MNLSEDNTPQPGIAELKKRAREQARKARAALTDVQRHAAAQACAELVLGLAELADIRTVLAYGASTEELDPDPIVNRLRARGVAVTFPRVAVPGVLDLHLVEDEAQLVPGSFGIREPGADSPRIPYDAIDAVIVPGVAFSPSGGRLGYGGGFYDRLLPALRPDCHRIAVCFDEQLVHDLPREPHDAAVDMIVTPTQVLRPGNDSGVGCDD